MNRDAVIRFALAAALALPGLARAQYGLEIIHMRHRTAEQVVPALQPLLEPGASLSGQGNHLFVRTSPGNLAELRRALETLDQPARRLQISVRFDDSFGASRRAFGASGRAGTQGADVEILARDAASSADQRVDQRIQVLEGGHATIYASRSEPVRERRYIQTPGGVVSQEVTVLQDTRLGFDIVPRIAGSGVQVEIAGSAGYTSASGPLGEWFELGSVAMAGERADRGLASAARSTASETRRVWIRVDPLP